MYKEYLRIWKLNIKMRWAKENARAEKWKNKTKENKAVVCQVNI